MQRISHFRLLRWWVRLVEWIHPSELQATLIWAFVIGCLGGLSAIAFRACVQGVLWCWTGRHSDSLEQVAAQLAWWQRLLIPAGGGLLAGLFLHYGARFGHGHRSTDYMEAVAVHRGGISIRRSLAKTLSSLMTIGSGGSIGREGAMVQLSATIASWLGEEVRMSTPRWRLMVACGAAGGIAGVYDVTVAGALFVAEIVLGSIAMESLGPLLIAAAASSLVSRYVGHTGTYFKSPTFVLSSPWELVAFLAMAVGLGVAAPAYVRLLRKTEDLFTAIVPHIYWRTALGGLIVGALAIPIPEVWGNGRTMVNVVLTNPWPWSTLAVILVCKVAATAVTTGSGAVGGVFTPTLFTGAMLGCLFGHLVNAISHGPAASPNVYALIAMGGFLAATTRAPVMSILMVMEMTLDLGMVLPLMLVNVVAYYTARSLQSDSIYSESLRRKQPKSTPKEVSALCVRDVLKPPPQTVIESTPFTEIARLFANAPYRHLLVVTLQNRLRGIISLREIEKNLQTGKVDEWATAGSLMRTEMEIITPETTLTEALEVFQRFKGERLAVVNNLEERKLVGIISKTDVLLAQAHGVSGGPH